MKKILVIVGHPYWKDSVANRAIIDEFKRINPDAEISNISELYPDGNIDVTAEQKSCLMPTQSYFSSRLCGIAVRLSCTSGWRRCWPTASHTDAAATS